ncbi:helix-turn-helix transcriptional regulator [Shewanella sp. MM_2022_3]|uniref:helix-turn-helix domain-containing protein n=1 Tax=Shewanella sp. MM_2022_3 TaxID=2923280 RepID=UPI001F4C50B9|nr:helix-turn-helix transcriptional regulator [Shewanella sp. MM_2022_3]MCH7421279.1 helix-turn-helix domain-containing protein [Shewanella sp. MM_2022_3]
MDDKNLIGQRIKAAREKQKLSQEELGDLMGVSFQSVQQWESGKTTPRTTRMRKLATVLKTSPNWLQFGMGQSTSENLDDILKFIRSDEFKSQACSAHAKSLQALLSMGWIGMKRNDVTMSIMNDVFFSKLLEEYGLDPEQEKPPAIQETLQK